MNHGDSPSGRDPVERLAESFLGRYRRGERPSLTDYIAAHPDLADEMRELFPALVELEGLKPGIDETVDRGPAPGPSPGRALPETLGDFRIVREIGRGGMGLV